MDFIETTVRMPAKPYLTKQEVCEVFRISAPTLKRWISDGRIAPPGPGRTWSNMAVLAAMLWREHGPPGAFGDDEEDDEDDDSEKPAQTGAKRIKRDQTGSDPKQ